VKDNDSGAQNLIWLAGRQRGRADPASLAADDILAALTKRIAELEARVSEILAEVAPEFPPVESKQDRALGARRPDAGRGSDKTRDARVEADAELARASEERRTLANEMRLLREAIQEAHRGQLPVGQGANKVEAQIAPDPQAAIAGEMRSLLTELFADFRSRVLAPRPVEPDAAKSETNVDAVAVASTPTVIAVAEPLQTAPPVVHVVVTEPARIVEHLDEPVSRRVGAPVDANVAPVETPPDIVDDLVSDPAAMETSASIVEDLEELVRPTIKRPVDSSVADLEQPEPVASNDPFALEAPPAQPAAAVLDELFVRSDRALSIDAAEFRVAPPEPAPPIVEEHVFGPAEPVVPIIDEFVEELRRPAAPPTFDLGPALAKSVEPISDEFIEELRRPEAPPLVRIELSAVPAEPIAPIVDEFIEELGRLDVPPTETVESTMASLEPSEPIVEDVFRIEPTQPIVDNYVVPPNDFTITPPIASSAPDPRLAALWDSAPPPTQAQTAPLSEAEPASFITEDFLAETRQIEVSEEAYPPQELAPEQTIDYVPPPVEFGPPLVESAPEPPAIAEPEPQTWAEPPITQPESAASFSSLFPELTIADERGLHEIQVVISPIHSFPRLLETERRIRMLSTVNALHLRDFRNGVATLTVSVGEAISPAEFGAVIQMLEELHLRLEGTTQSSVELRAESEPPTE